MRVGDYGKLYEPVVWGSKDEGESWHMYKISKVEGDTITFYTYDGASYVVTKSLLVGSVAGTFICKIIS